MTFLANLTRRGWLFLLVVGLILAAVPSAATAGNQGTARARIGTYLPVTGPIFNRPVGTRAEQMAIFTHINNTIDSTPAGATIRIAVFSFGQKPTADRLIAAHNRGVKVKMIFDSHSGAFPQVKRLRSALGTNRSAKSFVVLCNKSCRGTSGNMHAKFFLFSQAGGAKNVVMAGSNNLTLHNAEDQWSDVYTVVGDQALMNTFSSIFAEMVPDVAMAQPYRVADSDEYEAQFYPYSRPSMTKDPLYQALSQVQCVGTTGGTGDTVVTEYPGTPGDPEDPPSTVEEHVTRLRIAMHAWNGTRGRYLAQKVAALQSEGCHVRVILGVGAGLVVKDILANAGISISMGTYKKIRTHEKYLLLSGWYGENTASRIVWTGSHNWSNGSMRRDEVIFRAEDGRSLRAYQRNFKDIWANG